MWLDCLLILRRLYADPGMPKVLRVLSLSFGPQYKFLGGILSLDVDLFCDHCGNSIFSRNITHNLGAMAKEAGIYQVLWRPEEIGAKKGGDITEILKNGLVLLLNNPAHFQKMNPTNGWEDYKGLVDFIKEYLDNCINHPNATIMVSR